MRASSFVVALSLIFITLRADAQIPVTDAVSIAHSIQQQVETITRWKMQYDQMISQINQLENQVKAVTGSRGLGELFNNPELREYLPGDWQKVYDGVKHGGYAGLSGRSKRIYTNNQVFDACAVVQDTDARSACEERAVKPSHDEGVALDAFDAAKLRLKQIDQLMLEINKTQDAKGIAELQGRIAIEQAAIANEQTKLQLFAMVAAAEDKVQEQRQREIQSRIWASRKGIDVAPLTFDGR